MMALGNGVWPIVSCPVCKEGSFLLGQTCPTCGRTYVEAEMKAKGIGPHAYVKDDSGFDSCKRCGKIQDCFIHT